MPVFLTSTYAQDGVGQDRGYEYGRTGNPTRTALEACIASLEGARFGRAFASGLAAEDAVLRMLVPGESVVLGDDAYGGTFRLIDKVFGPMGVGWTVLDLYDPVAVDRDWPEGARLLWLETPTNPTLGVVDIEALSAWPGPTGPAAWSTTPSPPPTCSSPWRWGPTSSCTPPPST